MQLTNKQIQTIIDYIDGCNQMATDFGYQASDLDQTYIRILNEESANDFDGDGYSMVILVNFDDEDSCHLAGFMNDGRLDMIKSEVPERMYKDGDPIYYKELMDMIK